MPAPSRSVPSSLGRFAITASAFISQFLLPTPGVTQPVFKSLGDFSEGKFQSAAYDVSDDGSIVVGSGWNVANNKAFRWTELGGMVQLEQSATFYSAAGGVSADGSVVVGWIWNQATNRIDAFRWTKADGATPIGDLAGGPFESYANDVSADGTAIV